MNSWSVDSYDIWKYPLYSAPCCKCVFGYPTFRTIFFSNLIIRQYLSKRKKTCILNFIKCHSKYDCCIKRLKMNDMNIFRKIFPDKIRNQNIYTSSRNCLYNNYKLLIKLSSKFSHRIVAEFSRVNQSRTKYGSTLSRLHAPMQGLKWRGRTGSWPRSIGSVFVRKVSPSTLLPRLASNSRPVFAGSRQARSHSTPRAWRTFDRLCSIRRRFHSVYTTFIFTFRTYSFSAKFKPRFLLVIQFELEYPRLLDFLQIGVVWKKKIYG